ncbi:MAG TPA: nitrite/sulfite reductase, partial [Pseudomonas sp.]|nr:nitrite/sulfite reductase [Pseudomonas sp.]
YVEAILRVFNRHGRRDNKYKARIKILVKALGVEAFAREVEEEWQHIKDGPAELTEAEYQRVAAFFAPPAYAVLADTDLDYGSALARDREFARWATRNLQAHKVPGYAAVVLSTKPGPAMPPGDVTAAQMEGIAELAERYGFGEIRIAHEQNVVLPDVRKADLYAVWQRAGELGLATPNVGLLTDIIACPGGDYCSLANAKSIPIAQAIQQRFEDLDHLHDLGELSLNISGCMNACAHHHIGNIGILGVDKNGSEWYQVTIGGAQGKASALGKVIGPAFGAEQIPEVIERLVDTFLAYREGDEPFVDTVQRIGLEPFKERVYRQQEASA